MTGTLCPACGEHAAVSIARWRCDCGSPLEADGDPAAMRRAGAGDALRPLVAGEVGGIPVRWALEYAAPTGSYKDRGAAALVLAAAAVGARRAVEDSSGNAGIALAAAAAQAGLAVRLFVPEDASPEKVRLAKALGADVALVPGGRAEAEAAAQRAADGATFYASHAWSPFFIEGVASLALELADRLDRDGSHAVIVPCGNGGLVLGLTRGFAALERAGRIARRPAIVAVQAEGCAPLAAAFAAGAPDPTARPWPGTIADGIRVPHPPRGAQALRAVRASGGRFATVSDLEIDAAWRWLWAHGFPVERTSAVVAALLRREAAALREAYGEIVAVLTGAGIKGPTP